VQNNYSIEEITVQIKQKAIDLGFVKVGIARAFPLHDKFLKTWLANSYHAEMAWMQRTEHLRINPDDYFPGAKSVLSAAVNYYTADPERSAQSGQVSRYAAGNDYHEILEKRLHSLYSFIQDILPGVHGKIAVDTAPVLDKVWAALAGIGWIGKHSNIIIREYGSFVFLGEILLDCDLIFDKPAADFCGNCTKCIEACPTGAIVEPYVVDSNRCISYRTIEHKGDFPQEWTGENGDWIFGCDICQEVCPWNKNSQETKIEEFKTDRCGRFPLLSDLESLAPDDFRQRFNDSPLKRCKNQGLMRNTHAVKKYLSSLSKK